MKSDLIDLELHRHAQTDKAIFVSETGDKADAVWLPKSQIEIEDVGHYSTVGVTLPKRLAYDKGLI